MILTEQEPLPTHWREKSTSLSQNLEKKKKLAQAYHVSLYKALFGLDEHHPVYMKLIKVLIFPTVKTYV